MARTHSHELFYRAKGVLTRFAAHSYNEDFPREDLISLVEGVAKDGKTLNETRDSIVYKVDGKTEFFVSRYIYLWPNYTDRENHSKKRHSQNRR